MVTEQDFLQPILKTHKSSEDITEALKGNKKLLSNICLFVLANFKGKMKMQQGIQAWEENGLKISRRENFKVRLISAELRNNH